MKKYLTLGLLCLLGMGGGASAAIEDTSIIDELNKNTNIQNTSFRLEKFETCTDMSDVMGEYIKMYWENMGGTYRGGYGFAGGITTDEVAVEDVMINGDLGAVMENTSSAPSTGGGGADYSDTNVQVVGVDESDIIKTDGKYIYYFNSSDYYVYIVSLEEREVMKKIKIPETFYSPILYLANGKLTILSGGYANGDYSNSWINRYDRTYVIVYDVTNVNSPIIDKLYIVDGSLQESRRIGDYIYVVSNTSFNLPYVYYSSITKFEDFNYTLNKVMPQKIEVSPNSNGKYSVNSGNVANCNNISYILPDAETIKNNNIGPSYNIVSVIDTRNPNKNINTSVIAGNTSEIYMSQDNLYLTSYIYQTQNYNCPAGARCVMPMISSGANTLVHKLNIKGDALDYQDSTLIPGTPLTQYSMDEYEDNFRILTQINNWNRVASESYVSLFILDENLDLVGSLEKLGEGEQFKSSRYIGEKLFLVTFEQTDPLFVIDVATPSAPKVLGELKMPGYSTYLHPYDDNHLIGLGYDTEENEWGGIMNTGLKVDLYEVNYDKSCSDSDLTADEKAKCDSQEYKGIIVKQLYTYTLGDYGSYSEALNNPRMFMWHNEEKKLFLPASLSYNSSEDMYSQTDYFQGLIALTIDKDTGISKNYEITHIDYAKLEEARLKECSKYTTESTTPTCVKLINGEDYCQEQRYSYVPTYCYADAPLGEYLSSYSWNYNKEFISRALWVSDETFAISNSRISSHNMDTGAEVYRVELK